MLNKNNYRVHLYMYCKHSDYHVVESGCYYIQYLTPPIGTESEKQAHIDLLNEFNEAQSYYIGVLTTVITSKPGEPLKFGIDIETEYEPLKYMPTKEAFINYVKSQPGKAPLGKSPLI